MKSMKLSEFLRYDYDPFRKIPQDMNLIKNSVKKIKSNK